MSLDPDLQFLRDAFGFRVVGEEAPRPGERMKSVLESGALRIEVDNELGVRVLYFSSARNPSERHVDNALLNFIEHRHGLPREGETTARLQRHLPEIIAAFAPARPADWWNEYAAYREARLAERKRQR